MGKSSGGSTTTVQKADPWSGQAPFLTQGFNTAENLFFGPGTTTTNADGTTSTNFGPFMGGSYSPQYFNDAAAGVPSYLNASGTVAGFTPMQQAGLQHIADTGAFNQNALGGAIQSAADMAAHGALYQANPGNDIYQNVANWAMNNPSNSPLTALMNGGAMAYPQIGGLQSLSANAAGNPALSMFDSLASGATQQNNAGNNLLQDAAGSSLPSNDIGGLRGLSSAAAQNPYLSLLNPIASGTPQQNNIGNSLLTNAAMHPAAYPEIGALQQIAGQAANNGALSLLNPLATGQVQHDNLGNSFLAGTALNGATGNNALERYASGQMLGSANPAWRQMADSVTASTLPALEGQFTQGGAMNNPNAQYSIASGLASALAPFAEENYNTQTQNQINAANALAGNALSASGNLAGNILGGQQLQGQMAGELGSQYTSSLANAGNLLSSAGGLFNAGVGNQINASGQLANNILGGQQLQANAANNLASQYTSSLANAGNLLTNAGNLFNAGNANRINASGQLASNILGGQQLQLNAANDLGSQYTSSLANAGNLLTNSGNLFNTGIGNQIGAAGQLSSNLNSGFQNMLGAAQGVSGNYNTGNQQAIQSQLALPGLLSSNMENGYAGFQAGSLQQQQNQAQLSDMVNRWNYNQNLPLNMLNAFQQSTGGTYGGNTSLTQPYFQNPMANFLGTGMGALGLYNMGSQAGLWSGLGSLFGGGGGAAGGAAGLSDLMGTLAAFA